MMNFNYQIVLILFQIFKTISNASKKLDTLTKVCPIHAGDIYLGEIELKIVLIKQ